MLILGYQYLTYQRYVAVFQFILCIFGLGVILPTNLLVGTAFPASSFSATTMSNLVPRIHFRFYWLHLIFSFSIFPATLICMRLFCKHIDKLFDVHTTKISHTLYVSRLPKNLRSKPAIQDYFNQMYPGCKISSIDINIKVKSLNKLENEYHELQETIKEIRESGGAAKREPLFKLNFICSYCACSRRGAEEQLAEEYYLERLADVKKKLKEKAVKIYYTGRKLDSAFVKVESLTMARTIGNYVKLSLY
jgi:hypothetical protein